MNSYHKWWQTGPCKSGMGKSCPGGRCVSRFLFPVHQLPLAANWLLKHWITCRFNHSKTLYRDTRTIFDCHSCRYGEMSDGIKGKLSNRCQKLVWKPDRRPLLPTSEVIKGVGWREGCSGLSVFLPLAFSRALFTEHSPRRASASTESTPRGFSRRSRKSATGEPIKRQDRAKLRRRAAAELAGLASPRPALLIGCKGIRSSSVMHFGFPLPK